MSTARIRSSVRANLRARLAKPGPGRTEFNASLERVGGSTKLVFRGPGIDREEAIVLDMFLDLRGWLPAIVQAIILNAKRPEVTSISGRARLADALRAGFARFLRETGRLEEGPADLRRETLVAFIGWLNRSETGVAVLNEYARRAYYAALLQTLQLLREDPSFRADIIQASEMPVNPWPNAKMSLGGTRVLPLEDLGRIMSTCAAIVREKSEIVAATLAPESDTDLGIVVAELRQRMLAGKDVAYHHLLTTDRPMWKRMMQAGREAVYHVIQPSLTDLAPFLTFLSFYTRYNEATLLTMKVSDVQVVDWIGAPRLVFSSEKPRANGRRQRASAVISEDPTSSSSILRLIAMWTDHLRALNPTDGLVRYWKRKQGALGAAALADDTHGAAALRDALKAFARQEGLPPYSITEIRHALLDRVHVLTGDILNVRTAGGQESLNVVADHYITAAGRTREDEALAIAMRKLVATGATNGRYNGRRMEEGSQACTPGWTCLRPHDGPETIGGQCVAIGMCPACAHGRTDTSSPVAFAQILRLIDAIDRTLDNTSPEGWLDKFAPLRNHIVETIIPGFPEVVQSRGSNIHLPPLPTLE